MIDATVLSLVKTPSVQAIPGAEADMFLSNPTEQEGDIFEHYMIDAPCEPKLTLEETAPPALKLVKNEEELPIQNDDELSEETLTLPFGITPLVKPEENIPTRTIDLKTDMTQAPSENNVLETARATIPPTLSLVKNDERPEIPRFEVKNPSLPKALTQETSIMEIPFQEKEVLHSMTSQNTPMISEEPLKEAPPLMSLTTTPKKEEDKKSLFQDLNLPVQKDAMDVEETPPIAPEPLKKADKKISAEQTNELNFQKTNTKPSASHEMIRPMPVSNVSATPTRAFQDHMEVKNSSVFSNTTPLPENPEMLSYKCVIDGVKLPSRTTSGELRLSLIPESLGRVDIKISMTEEGRLDAVVNSQHADTHDLFQRDASALQKTIEEAFQAHANDINLSFTHGEHQQPQQEASFLERASHASTPQDNTTLSAASTTYTNVDQNRVLDQLV